DVEWEQDGHIERMRASGDPLELLRAKLAALRPVALEGTKLPRFLGGAVGMVSYDWVRFVERVPDANPDETGMPDLWFVLPETIVVVDNVRKTAAIVRHVAVDGDTDLGRAYADAVTAVDAVVERLRESLPAEPRHAPVRAPMDVRRSVTREAF